MRRLRWLAATAAFAATCALFVGTTPTLATTSCTDSWGSDGHSGPWYVGSNQSLHGNTVVITCPSGATSWSVHYLVEKMACKSGCVGYFPIDITRSGSGSTSFSVSTSPVGCNQGWDYLTHVHNIVTGGNIYKPGTGGEVIC